MRRTVSYTMALAMVFVISAGVSFVANGADLDSRYDDRGGYKPAIMPASSWAGWYAGALIGYGASDADLGLAGTGTIDADGIIGGGLLGFNWQTGRLVLSLEGDVLAAGLDDSVTFGPNRVRGEIDWMGGVRARAGVTTNSQTLLFVMLGYGWADYDLPMSGPGGGGASETFGGLQLGGGAEFKLNSKWSARLDYLYTDLGDETITYGGGSTVNYDADLHQIRGGLVVKF